MSFHEKCFTERENMLPFDHYAIVFQDKEGAIKATGSDLFKDTRSWFTQDLRERFHDIIRNPSGQPTQSPADRPAKRYKTSVDDSDKQKTAVRVLPDYNALQVTAQYWQTFSRLLQADCQSMCRAWIELIDPDKRQNNPYSRGDNVKPNWWPDIPHRSAHHLRTDERVTLLIHILRMSGKGKITCAELQNAAAQKAASYKAPTRTQDLLNKIFAIRKDEEKMETRCDHDGITAGPPDEELNCGLVQVSGSASDEGRGRSPVGSPEDQIKEISPISPSVKSSPGFVTPSSYPSTSEALHMNEQQQVPGYPSWPYLNNPSSEHTMHRYQLMQPIQSAYHSCCPHHCFLMAQHNGFDPVDSTPPCPSSSQQTLSPNPASYAHTASYSLPHQSWLNENNNDNNNWTSFSERWNHQHLHKITQASHSASFRF